MASNKVACVHITCNDIRLLEGRVNEGVILVTHAVTIPKANRFFSGDRVAFMQAMVDCIANAMKVNSFTAKTLHVVYDNNCDVEYFLDEKLTRRREEKEDRKRAAKNKQAQSIKEREQGTIVHKKAWGRFITETEMGELYTTVTMERDFVNFLVSEFQHHGLKVASLEVPETAIFYLRKMVPYSYDSLNKLVVYANNQTQGFFCHFVKDAPAGNKALHFDEFPAPNFPQRVAGIIREEITRSGLGNPHIMLIGDAFEDPRVYIECCKLLKEDGLFCIDTYGLWHDKGLPSTCVRVILPNTGEELDMGGQYGICVALLARILDSKPENMIEGFRPQLMAGGAKVALANFAMAASIMLVIYTGVSLGVSWYEVNAAETEYHRLETITESKLSAVEKNRDELKAQVSNLATIDERYNAIFKFVYAQVNENLNIASVDTENMIPVEELTDSNYANTANSGTTAEGEEANPAADVTAKGALDFQKEVIVIRGYSRTTAEPVELYDALVGAGLGNVTIVGIEQVPLPSEETLFAFELTVGTEEGA